MSPRGGARPGAGRKTTEAKTSSVTIRISPKILTELKGEAGRLRLSFSEYLRTLLAAQVRIIGWRVKEDG